MKKYTLRFLLLLLIGIIVNIIGLIQNYDILIIIGGFLIGFSGYYIYLLYKTK